jgi:hypothetical protein
MKNITYMIILKPILRQIHKLSKSIEHALEIHGIKEEKRYNENLIQRRVSLASEHD